MLDIESWKTEFDQRFPIYEQISSRFCRALVKGDLSQGDRIPSIRDLAIILKVNANTVQRAYQELERKNIIYSQRGTGYFVMQDDAMVANIKNEMVQDSIARFLVEMHALGFDDSQILNNISKQLKGEKSQ